MNQEFTDNLEEIVEYGLDTIDPKETVEVNLKDLMYVNATLQEFMRFFHQPLHYHTLDNVNKFLGSIDDNAGFKILHTAIYKKLYDMPPDHIDNKFDEGVFDCPKSPFYFKKNETYRDRDAHY